MSTFSVGVNETSQSQQNINGNTSNISMDIDKNNNDIMYTHLYSKTIQKMNQFISETPKLKSLHSINENFIPKLIEYIITDITLPTLENVICRNENLEKQIKILNEKDSLSNMEELLNEYTAKSINTLNEKLKIIENKNKINISHPFDENKLLKKFKNMIDQQNESIKRLDDFNYNKLKHTCAAAEYVYVDDIIKYIFASISKKVSSISIINCTKYIWNFFKLFSKVYNQTGTISIFENPKNMRIGWHSNGTVTIQSTITWFPNIKCYSIYECPENRQHNKTLKGFNCIEIEKFIQSNLCFNVYGLIYSKKQYEFRLHHFENGVSFEMDENENFVWKINKFHNNVYKVICLIASDDIFNIDKDKHNTLKICQSQRLKSGDTIQTNTRGILSPIGGIQSTVQESNRNSNGNWSYAGLPGNNGFFGDGGVYQGINENEQKELQEIRQREEKMRHEDSVRYSRVGRDFIREDQQRERSRSKRDKGRDKDRDRHRHKDRDRRGRDSGRGRGRHSGRSRYSRYSDRDSYRGNRHSHSGRSRYDKYGGQSHNHNII